MKSIPVSDLEAKMPSFNWRTLHKAIPSSYPVAHQDQKILVYDLVYLQALHDVILPRVTPRTIMNYMMWHAIFDLTQLLPDKERENEFKHNIELYGTDAIPRWRECVKVANKMTYALSALYIKEYFDDDTKSATNGIAHRIHEELRHVIGQVDWMDEETKKQAYLKAGKIELNIGFTEKLKLNDLSKVEEKYEGVNGIATLDENIADNGGLKLAYRAYKRLEATLATPELGLPGLPEFNNDQLFFLALANQYCTAYRTGVLYGIILHGDHAPEEFRLNGPLMNLPEFGAVFGCAPGTKMNPKPEDRCEVW